MKSDSKSKSKSKINEILKILDGSSFTECETILNKSHRILIGYTNSQKFNISQLDENELIGKLSDFEWVKA